LFAPWCRLKKQLILHPQNHLVIYPPSLMNPQ